MLEKKTVIDQVEILRSGTVQIRFAKCVVEDGIIISQQWHRTSVAPGESIDAQLAAVDAHLPMLKEPPVTDEPGLSGLSRQACKDIVARTHTPEVVHRYREEQRLRRQREATKE